MLLLISERRNLPDSPILIQTRGRSHLSAEKGYNSLTEAPSQFISDSWLLFSNPNLMRRANSKLEIRDGQNHLSGAGDHGVVDYKGPRRHL